MGAFNCPRWVLMWALAVLVFSSFKILTYRRALTMGVPLKRRLFYLFLWPGMDAAKFLNGTKASQPAINEWLVGFLKVAAGTCLIVSGSLFEDPLTKGWFGMVGLILMLHFGSFHLLSCFWRLAGIHAEPIMREPLKSTSVAEFWGRRWNVAFRDLTFRLLFRPLGKRLGVKWGTLAGFFFSGLIHELVITVPAGGGYGGPTLFFLLQGCALLVEKRFPMALGSGWRGWCFTQGLLIVTVPLLFPPVFVLRIMVPFFQAIGVY